MTIQTCRIRRITWRTIAYGWDYPGMAQFPKVVNDKFEKALLEWHYGVTSPFVFEDIVHEESE